MRVVTTSVNCASRTPAAAHHHIIKNLFCRHQKFMCLGPRAKGGPGPIWALVTYYLGLCLLTWAGLGPRPLTWSWTQLQGVTKSIGMHIGDLRHTAYLRHSRVRLLYINPVSSQTSCEFTDILRMHRHPMNSQPSYEFKDIL